MMLPSVAALAAQIPDGALVAMPPDNSLPSVALAKALIRKGARRLRLLGVPVSGFATDILIGAGCVAEVETSAVSLGEAGFAPRFSAALKAGRITVRDATCPAIHTMLQASEKGVPFMPLRGIIGSDILANRPDWKVIGNPFATEGEDPIVLLPAKQPDFAVFHAAMADSEGNVWLGRRRECATIAHASKAALVAGRSAKGGGAKAALGSSGRPENSSSSRTIPNGATGFVCPGWTMSGQSPSCRFTT